MRTPCVDFTLPPLLGRKECPRSWHHSLRSLHRGGLRGHSLRPKSSGGVRFVYGMRMLGCIKYISSSSSSTIIAGEEQLEAKHLSYDIILRTSYIVSVTMST